jgi:predicted XRE-type DNA-binding protein
MVDIMLSDGEDVFMARRTKLSDQIRKAVDQSDMTRYRICMETDIDQPSMSRFMAGKVGMSLERLDRLADLLDLRLEAPIKHRTTR